MRKRSRARELALHILYQIDITHEKCEAVLEKFWKNQEEDSSAEVKSFTEELVCGLLQQVDIIDEKISKYATNWQLERMAVIDRNVLRLGGFELMFRDDIPPKVSINEAVELAKKYSGLESGKFVNAILDKIKSEINK